MPLHLLDIHADQVSLDADIGKWCLSYLLSFDFVNVYRALSSAWEALEC